MTCPRCGGDRLALVAVPEQGPTDLRVCLGCAHLWSVVPDARYSWHDTR